MWIIFIEAFRSSFEGEMQTFEDLATELGHSLPNKGFCSAKA